MPEIEIGKYSFRLSELLDRSPLFRNAAPRASTLVIAASTITPRPNNGKKR
jgi:hypothetical protein